jgi:hypothetical protein
MGSSMHLAIKRLARTATIAVAIVALPGSCVTTRPMIASLGDVAFKLSAGLSEVEAVRRKITGFVLTSDGGVRGDSAARRQI